MNKKDGRQSENPKVVKFQIRMDLETVDIMDECVARTNLSKSDIVRRGLILFQKSLSANNQIVLNINEELAIRITEKVNENKTNITDYLIKLIQKDLQIDDIHELTIARKDIVLNQDDIDSTKKILQYIQDIVNNRI